MAAAAAPATSDAPGAAGLPRGAQCPIFIYLSFRVEPFPLRDSRMLYREGTSMLRSTPFNFPEHASLCVALSVSSSKLSSCPTVSPLRPFPEGRISRYPQLLLRVHDHLHLRWCRTYSHLHLEGCISQISHFEGCYQRLDILRSIVLLYLRSVGSYNVEQDRDETARKHLDINLGVDVAARAISPSNHQCCGITVTPISYWNS